MSAKTCALKLRDYRSYHDALPVIPSCEDNEGPHERGIGLRKLICAIQQCRRGPSLALGMTMVLYLGTCAAELLRARYSPEAKSKRLNFL